MLILLHGCGGVQSHLDDYATRAVAAGWRAAIVDSYGPRGWSRAFGLTLVCSGMTFWGAERAGDILAALHGLSARPDVDAGRIALAGWSHGGWSIMDLMTMPLLKDEEARVAGADPALLDGVKGLFLVYPYVGFGSRSRHRKWVRSPAVTGIIAARDHLGKPDLHEAAYDSARAAGCAIQTVTLDATHAFDQPDEPLLAVSPMRRDPALAADSLDRMERFLAGI